jgi:hypothetical protein
LATPFSPQTTDAPQSSAGICYVGHANAVPDFSPGLRYVLVLRQSDTPSDHSDDECNRVKDWITLAQRVLRVELAARDPLVLWPLVRRLSLN